MWDKAVGKLEAKIYEYVKFEFTIFHKSADGFVILDVEKAALMPLEKALEVIESDGFLDRSNFESF